MVSPGRKATTHVDFCLHFVCGLAVLTVTLPLMPRLYSGISVLKSVATMHFLLWAMVLI